MENINFWPTEKNVVVEIMNIEEIRDYAYNFSTTGSIGGITIKGLIKKIGPKVPDSFGADIGNIVVVQNYETIFEQRHFAAVNYNSISTKFQEGLPIALNDYVSVEVLSIPETVGNLKNDLFSLAKYDQSVNGSCKAIVVSIGPNAPESFTDIVKPNDVVVIDNTRSIFERRYYTSIKYKSIRTTID